MLQNLKNNLQKTDPLSEDEDEFYESKSSVEDSNALSERNEDHIPKYDDRMDYYFRHIAQVYEASHTNEKKLTPEHIKIIGKVFRFFNKVLENITAKKPSLYQDISKRDIKNAWRESKMSILQNLKFNLIQLRQDIQTKFDIFIFVSNDCLDEKCLNNLEDIDIFNVFTNTWSDTCNYLSNDTKLTINQLYGLFKPNKSNVGEPICDILEDYIDSLSTWHRTKRNFNFWKFKDVLANYALKFVNDINLNNLELKSTVKRDTYKDNYNVFMLFVILFLLPKEAREKSLEWGKEYAAKYWQVFRGNKTRSQY
jgi:hypothetical protein